MYYVRFYNRIDEELTNIKENKSLNKLKKELKEYGFKTEKDQLGYIFILEEDKPIGQIENSY